ncbi:carboxypeptidase regulatory-like domain-containing protein [Aeoliella sp. ICT_H6.2]|uniref:Carboxypeptidase regulatory-like domain-containing protein n=1 Tax=Aeoliella straminimaris TaxID=2954799 RepID=A0A9X2FG08_9BACT|nr:carboxypeptidase regulatory-like domain-containing protein [Aeoliella straminimaris]MCO6047613.1 carboxypeptidase regulatory-like domain-containing protein [Aeoliella straminimaris]
MNAWYDYALGWFADYYLLSTLLLAVVLLVGKWMRQPARRLTLAWATVGSLVLLGVLLAVPGWSVVHLFGTPPPQPELALQTIERTYRLQEAPVAESPFQEDQRNTVYVHSGTPTFESSLSESSPSTAQTVPAAEIHVVNWSPYVLAPFVLGSAVVLTWLVLGAWQTYRMVRRSNSSPPEVESLLSALCDAGDRRPRLRLSQWVATGVALGLIRPMILLPQSYADRQDAEGLRSVLAHELAHLRRGDLWMLAAIRCLMIVIWAHPLYWFFRRRVRLDQETLADAAAAELTSRTSYAEQLVGWARQLESVQTPTLAGAVGLWETKSQLRKRIAVLLDERLTILRDCSKKWKLAALVLCGTVALGLSLLTIEPGKANAEEMTADASETTTDEASGEVAGPPANQRGVLEGRVVDRDGNPVAGAEVALVLGNNNPNEIEELVTTVLTNSEGYYQLPLEEEQRARQVGSLWARALGHSPTRDNGTWSLGALDNKEGFQIVLPRADSTEFVLLDADRKAVSGATLHVRHIRVPQGVGYQLPKQWADDYQAISDSEGRLRVMNMLPDSVDTVLIDTVNSGRLRYDLNYFLNENPARVEPHYTMCIPPAGSLAGNVVSEAQDAPLQTPIAFTSEVRPPWGASVGVWGLAEATPGEAGQFEVPEIAAGVVRADWKGDPSESWRAMTGAPQKIEPEGFANFAVKVVRGVEVRGRVVKSGTGAGYPDFRLTLQYGATPRETRNSGIASRVVTDENGSYSAILPPGYVKLRIQSAPRDYRPVETWKPEEQSLTRTPRKIPTDVKTFEMPPLELVPTKHIEGTLVDQNNLPLDDWSVYGYPTDGDISMNSFAGVDTRNGGKFAGYVPETQLPTVWKVSFREWTNEFSFEDKKYTPEIVSKDPLVLQVDVDGQTKEQREAKDVEEISVSEENEGSANGEQSNSAKSTVTGTLTRAGGQLGVGTPNFRFEQDTTPNVVEGICQTPDGEPASGVTVSLYRSRQRSDDFQLLHSLQMGADGRFKFADILPADKVATAADDWSDEIYRGESDAYMLVVKKPGSVTRYASAVKPAIATGINARITLEPSATLTGVVTDPDGKPVAGAQVSASRGVTSALPPGIHTARTDAQGRYSIDDAAPFDREQYDKAMLEAGDSLLLDVWVAAEPAVGESEGRLPPVLSVTHPDYALKRVPYDAIPGTTDVQLELSAVITGRVVDVDGKPLGGGQVQAYSEIGFSPDADTVYGQFSLSAETDDEGRYRIEQSPAGVYDLQLVVANSAMPESLPRGVTGLEAKAGEENSAPDIQLQRGGLVEVQLVDVQTDKPISLKPGAEAHVNVETVEAGRMNGSRYFRSPVGEDGKFTMRSLAGSTKISVQQAGTPYDSVTNSMPEWQAANGYQNVQTVDVVAGETVKIDMEMQSLELNNKLISLGREANLLSQQGKYAEAAQKQTEAIEIAEGTEFVASHLLMRANYWERAKEHRKAIADIERVTSMETASPLANIFAQLQLATLLVECEDQSLRDYKRAIELGEPALAEVEAMDQGSPVQPEIIKAYAALAKAYEATGEPEKAREIRERLRKSEPKADGESKPEKSSTAETESAINVSATDIPTETLEIRVVDEDGEPVEGATLTPAGLRAPNDGSYYGWGQGMPGMPPVKEYRTDADGRVSFAYPKYIIERKPTAVLIVHAAHADFVDGDTELPVELPNPTVVLKAGGRVEFEVKLSDGTVPKERLYCVSERWGVDNSELIAAGVLQTPVLPVEKQTLRVVYLPDDGPAQFSTLVTVAPKAGETMRESVVLHPGTRLVGELDESVSRPVVDGHVIAHVEGSLGNSWEDWAKIAEDGTFVFESLPRDEGEVVQLVGVCDGFVSTPPGGWNDETKKSAPQLVALDEGEVRHILAMAPTAKYLLHLTDETGNPIEGVEATLAPNVQWRSGASSIVGYPKFSTRDMLVERKTARDLWNPDDYPYRAISDATGTATWLNVPPNEKCMLQLSHDDYQLPVSNDFGTALRLRMVEVASGAFTEETIELELKGQALLGSDGEVAVDAAGGETPADPTKLSGIVLGTDGKPLADVDVDAWTWHPGNETESDKEGRFELTGFEPSDDVEIEFTKPGYCPRYFVSKRAGSRGWIVRMSDDTWMEGIVTDAAGDPAPGVEIRAERGPFDNPNGVIGEVKTTTTTDSKGRYKLMLEPDTYALKIRDNQGQVFRQAGLKLGTGDHRNNDIQLAPGLTFRAKIVDSETGEPVEGITLWNWRHQGIEGTSGADGMLEIPGMFPGAFAFQVTAKGADRTRDACAGDYARWWSPDALKDHQRKSIQPGEFQRNLDDLDFDLDGVSGPLEPVTIFVEKCAIVRGRVVDPDGKPVADATVAPAKTGSGNSLTGDTRYSYTTAEDGTFEAKLPASGGAVYNLVAHDGKYGEWRNWANGVGEPFVTQPGQEIDGAELQLTRGATVRGQVLNAAGKPVAMTRVRAAPTDKFDNRYYHPEVRTDGQGRFELKFIRPGEHWIQAEPFWLRAEEAPPGTSKKVQLKPGEVVEGVILASPGAPVDLELEVTPLSNQMAPDGAAEGVAAEEEPNAPPRTDFTLVIAKHMMLLDGKEFITWQDLEDRIAKLPDPSVARLHYQITHAALETGAQELQRAEHQRLADKFNFRGYSIGGFSLRGSHRFDQLETAADLIDDPADACVGQVIDSEGQPVEGAEVIFGPPVDESLFYRTRDIYLENGKLRSHLDDVVAVTNAEGRFTVYPAEDDLKYYLIAMHPEHGFALVTRQGRDSGEPIRLAKWASIQSTILPAEGMEQTASVSTRVAEQEGLPELSLNIHVPDSQPRPHNGEFNFLCVPPNLPCYYQRGIKKPQGVTISLPTQELTLKPGEVREITLGGLTPDEADRLELHEQMMERRQGSTDRKKLDDADATYSAHVIDAETGEPIEQFLALPGTSFMDGYGWQWQDHLITSFADGQLVWPPKGRRPYQSQAIRVEAEGYVPFETKEILSDAPQRGQTIRLQPSDGIAGRLVDADDKPVAGATVAIAMCGRTVRIDKGKIVRRELPADASLRDRWGQPRSTTTAKDGAFTLPDESAPAVLIATHPEGVAILSLEWVREHGKVHLEPWGRIEGQVLWGKTPGAGESITMSARGHRDPAGLSIMLMLHCSDEVTSGDDGQFVFDKVPPGVVQVSRASKPTGESRIRTLRPTQFVEVLPGVPTEMIFGGGRPVIGKLVGRESWEGVRLSIATDAPPFSGPIDMIQQDWNAYSDFNDSEAGKHYSKQKIKVNDDGTFRIEGVPAARFNISVVQWQDEETATPIGRSTFRMETITPGEEKTPLDIGQIEVAPAQQ